MDSDSSDDEWLSHMPDLKSRSNDPDSSSDEEDAPAHAPALTHALVPAHALALAPDYAPALASAHAPALDPTHAHDLAPENAPALAPALAPVRSPDTAPARVLPGKKNQFFCGKCC